jgi:UDPglucose--hexose-1-phosphate uridylyltransferase
MSVIRQDPITKDWTIFASGRSERPNDFREERGEVAIKEYESSCPFCGGNEHMTPKEVLTIQDGENWQVRVVPNKFPILKPAETTGKDIRRYNAEKFYLEIDGKGSHEVIVESPLHSDNLCNLDPGQITNVVEAYRSRFLELSKNKNCRLIVIFRNHGNRAGTSLIHPHSQLVAVPFIPGFIRNRLYEAEKYFDDSGKCAYCDMISHERKIKDRIIYENESFIALAPYASVVPYNIFILPKEHMACFSQIHKKDTGQLALTLKVVLRKLYNLLDDPDYNYIIDSAPVDCKGSRYYHWYINLLPRLVTRAGFEIGSGINVNTILPEKCAELLREIDD